MAATEPPERAPRGPWGLVAAVVLVACCEATLARHSDSLTRQDNWEWRLSGRAASERSAGAGVLAFGSSLTKLGVIPKVLEPAVGMPILNLGVGGRPQPALYFLLERALPSGSRPMFILVEFHPQSIAHDHRHALAFWPDLLDARETIELAIRARHARFLGVVTMARLLPSYKDRFETRSRLLAAFRGAAGSGRDGVRALVRNLRRNNRALIVSKTRDGPVLAIPSEETSTAARTWAPDPLNVWFMDQLLQTAECHGACVVGLIPPACPGLLSVRARSGTDARYRSSVPKMAERRPGVVLLDGWCLDLEHGSFIDAQHLNREGATLWSLALASALSRLADERRDAPRWVVAERPGASEIACLPRDTAEDFTQSMLALGSEANGARR